MSRQSAEARHDGSNRGGFVLPPFPASAVPTDPSIAAHGVRTIPPRGQGGNIDIKQLSKGAHLLLPVDTPGALFSAGDAHYAPGDHETCGTAIEMNATLHVRFSVRKGEAAQKGMHSPTFIAPECSREVGSERPGSRASRRCS